MKLDAVIIKDVSSGAFTGFIRQYPSVCSQADDVKQLANNLDRNLKLYFDYCSKSELSVNYEDVLTL